MIKNLSSQIISGIGGIYLASQFIPGISFAGPWSQLLLTGAVLGLANFFLKPILKFITLPLRLLTLGLFGLIINLAIIWLVAIFFPELAIGGIIPLLEMSLLIWGLNLILPKIIGR